MNKLIEEKLSSLPLVPGCYLMKNSENEIIYVGKAKKLKNRVSSYFLLKHTGKTEKMVTEVVDFDIIITNSEREALLLEINLIHKHYPRYNILLKDDRKYPYIQISKDADPMLRIVRNTKDKKAKYWGPYSNSGAAYEMVQLLNQLYPFRKCQKIPKKACLYYHLNQCLGPCINKIEVQKYQELINNVDRFLNGEVQSIKEEYSKRMLDAAELLHFEEAKEYRKILESIQHIISSQKVELLDRSNLDVIAFQEKSDFISIAILMYRAGILNAKETAVLNSYGSIDEIISSYIIQFYQNHIPPKELIMGETESKEAIAEVLNLKIINPIRGIKKDLLIMAGENARKAMDDYFIYNNNSTIDDKEKILKELGDLLNIKPPRRIELFDNSHIQGDAAVAAMVVFINGVSAKKEYRKYKIKQEEKRSDTFSMKEIIKRRINRMIEEKSSVPDLIIVDGGIAQVNAALEVIEEFNLDINVAGLAKNNKHRTDALIKSNGERIELNTASKLFYLLTRMQDEVHRFAISFFRNLKSKSLTSSILDNIEGVGPKRKEILLRAFGSIQNLQEASSAELQQYVSEEVAQNIKKALEN